MSRRSRSCAFLLAFLLFALPVAAQAPDLVMGTVPVSNDANQTVYSASGSIGGEGFTFVWDSAIASANGTFLGATPGPGEAPPHFALAWYDLPAGLPLQVNVASATDARYSYSCSWGPAEGDPVGTVGDPAIVGDYSFGTEVPPAEALAVHLILVDGKCDWDLTMNLAWGEGVAAEATSWGQVKALYR